MAVFEQLWAEKLTGLGLRTGEKYGTMTCK